MSILVRNIQQLITLVGQGPRSGRQMCDLKVIEHGAVLTDGERIAAVGETAEIERSTQLDSVEVIDAAGMMVMPGFVDPHTHLVYGGSREKEFELRLQGVDYAEIKRRGGGIMSTVRATRETPQEELVAVGLKRLSRLLACGTTTVEVKSGYGLDEESELKMLRAIKELDDIHVLDLVSTFLGAHAIPGDVSQDEYKDTVINQMLPEVSRLNLAEFCDVFCERGFFGYEESKEILLQARNLGFKLKIHADELSSCGGSELAGELRAISADHLVYPSPNGVRLMREAGVIAVLLPGTVFMLGLEEHPPARKLIESAVPVALASDFNPGTCTIESMQIIVGLAALLFGMSPAEVITASTVNAAYAIDRGDEIGSLEPGKLADFLVLDVPNYQYLVYHFATNYLKHVIKRGKLVFSR